MNTGTNRRPHFTSKLTVLPSVGIALILATSASTTGCQSTAPPARATVIDSNRGNDPSDANLAPVYNPPPASSAPRSTPQNVRALAAQQSYTPQQSSEQYGQPAAPIEYQTPNPAYSSNQPSDNGTGSSYDAGEAAGFEALADVSQPPPPLPQYDQPPVPEPNDLWTPGYWNYAPQGYFWVPGAWVAPPYAGALWTPAYWGYDGGRYRLHRGFWARHIGFYGGINYGYGYTGVGYSGGYWNGNSFYYNRSVNHVNITNIHNVYERNITVNNITRVSYNGGNGGIQTRPGPQELAVLHEQRVQPTATQVQLREASSQNRQQFFNENHGRPAEPFVTRPIAAERTVQPVQSSPQPSQQPRPLGQALNQQRFAPEQQHQTPADVNRFQVQRQSEQSRTPGIAGQEHLTVPQPTSQPNVTPAQQQNAVQQQRNSQQQPVGNRQSDQQRLQQQQAIGQLQADQQQHLQQQRNTQQQQAEQQQRLQQQQLGNQQPSNQQQRFQQQTMDQQRAQQQQQRPAQQQVEQQRSAQPRSPQFQQQIPARPQQPVQQQHLQPAPQSHPQAQPAPRAETSHRPN